MIPRIDELLRDELKVLPHLVHLLDKAPEAIEAVIDGRVKDPSRHVPDQVGMGDLSERREVAVNPNSKQRRTTSTFSCDIACPVSPGAGRAAEGTEPKTGE
jgi:hypothetical protein